MFDTNVIFQTNSDRVGNVRLLYRLYEYWEGRRRVGQQWGASLDGRRWYRIPLRPSQYERRRSLREALIEEIRAYYFL